METSEKLLELFDSFEELLDNLDITPQEVLEILIKGGHIEVPDYVR